MLNKIKTIFNVTTNLKIQSVSMRRKLMLYWCVMILTMVILFLLLFSLTGIFDRQDQKLKESLELHLNHTSNEMSQQMDRLLAQSITFSEQISRELESLLTVNGKNIQDLNDSPDLLKELQENLFGRLYTLLLSSESSGAYFVLDVTTNTKIDAADHSRSGMHLRFANLHTKNAASQDVVFFRGIPDVARKEGMELHNRWNLEFNKAAFPEYEQVIQQKVLNLSKTGCWSKCVRLTDTWEDVVLLMVPILDSEKNTIGICGVEISKLYFYYSYPAIETPFGVMSTVLAPVNGESIDLKNGLIASTDDTNTDSFDNLEVKHAQYYNIYTTNDEIYLGNHCELNAQSAANLPMGVAAILKKEAFDKTMVIHSWGTILFFAAFFFIMFGFSVFLTNRFVNPITESFQAIQNELYSTDKQSGIYEVDRLLEFINIKMKNQISEEQDIPKNLEELLQAFKDCAKTLTVSERRILNYYIEGFTAAEIAEKDFISISTVRKHSGNIYRKLNISSRDELLLYVDLFRRCGRLDELMNFPPKML